jgi:hypothetical protein
MDNLLSCPFCGGKAEIIDLGDPKEDSYVHCINRTCEVQQIAKYDQLGATMAWNCRSASHPVATGEREAVLQEALEEIIKEVGTSTKANKIALSALASQPRSEGKGEREARERDATRYRRLQVLGCAPSYSKHLKTQSVLRFSNLDEFIDADLIAQPYRGEAIRPAALASQPRSEGVQEVGRTLDFKSSVDLSTATKSVASLYARSEGSAKNNELADWMMTLPIVDEPVFSSKPPGLTIMLSREHRDLIVGALRSEGRNVSASELTELHEWMREPDWAEKFSLEDMKNWINSRPTNITARLAAPSLSSTAHATPVHDERFPSAASIDALPQTIRAACQCCSTVAELSCGPSRFGPETWACAECWAGEPSTSPSQESKS